MSKPSNSPVVYELRIVPLPSDLPAEQRLKMLLKAMLRRFGFRCVRIVEVKREGRE